MPAQHWKDGMKTDIALEADLGDDRQYRLLVNAVIDYGIYMLDPAGTVTLWNRGAQRFKGYEAHEIIGRNFACFFTEGDQADRVHLGKPLAQDNSSAWARTASAWMARAITASMSGSGLAGPPREGLRREPDLG